MKVDSSQNTHSNSAPLQNDINEMASGAMIAIIGKFVGRGIQALTQVILARYFGPAIYGVFALGWTIFRILGALAPLGLNQGVLRFGTPWVRDEREKFKGVVITAVSTGVLSSALIGILLILVAPVISNLLDMPGLTFVLRIFAGTLPLLAGIKIISATLQTTRNMKPSVLMEDFSQPVILFLLVLGILLVSAGVNAATIAVFSSFFVATLLGIFLLRQTFPSFSSQPTEFVISRREFVAFSLPTALAGIFTLLTVWTDRLFLAYFLTSDEVGIYQAISQSSILFAVVLQGISAIFTPMISSMYQQNRLDRLNELYKISTRWAVYLAIPLLLVILVAPSNLVGVVFGTDYLDGVAPLVILTIGQFVNLSTGTVGFILLMTGYERRWFNISIVSFALNIILNLFLIPRFGVTGAAWATAVSISVLYTIGLYFVFTTHNLWPYNAQYLKGLGATAVTFVFLLLFNRLQINSQYLLFIGNVLISSVGFVGSLFIFGFAEEDKLFLDLIKNRVGKLKNE